ncbi:MAG: family 43 glycosylhydrolase [Treponema sp.]|nr:family 43 glycosylhydrolase [Treponema sp.]
MKKNFKTIAIIQGALFIMASLSTGCASTSLKTESTGAGKLTEMQLLMAEKAVKTQADNNPFAIHKFSADPAVLVYNDTVYIYATNDNQQIEVTKGKDSNGYGKINTLNVFSSKDLVNWTDCGEIAVAGRQNPKGAAKWANNSWAPAICSKKIDGKDKFFLYFADNGSGIGVLTSDSPTGPFKDPLGTQLVSWSTPNIRGGVIWLFDPAVFVDDDGNGYLYFGGGVGDDKAHPKTGRCVALEDDMIHLKDRPVEIDAPWLFEDSGINKFGDTYYYSYCANWDARPAGSDPKVTPPIATIAYMTSKNPLGPFEYQGYTLKNPSAYFGPDAGGNNHHWIFEFKGKQYIAFHAPTVEKQLRLEKGGYRSLFIADFKINEDGSLPIQTATKKGVEQVGKFNPYCQVAAATMHSSNGIGVTSSQTIVNIKDNAYLCIKGVDLSSGASKIKFNLSEDSKGSIKVMLKHWSSGEEIAEVKVNGTSAEADITLPESLDDEINLFFAFSGNIEAESWEIQK